MSLVTNQLTHLASRLGLLHRSGYLLRFIVSSPLASLLILLLLYDLLLRSSSSSFPPTIPSFSTIVCGFAPKRASSAPFLSITVEPPPLVPAEPQRRPQRFPPRIIDTGASRRPRPRSGSRPLRLGRRRRRPTSRPLLTGLRRRGPWTTPRRCRFGGLARGGKTILLRAVHRHRARPAPRVLDTHSRAPSSPRLRIAPSPRGQRCGLMDRRRRIRDPIPR